MNIDGLKRLHHHQNLQNKRRAEKQEYDASVDILGRFLMFVRTACYISEILNWLISDSVS